MIDANYDDGKTYVLYTLKFFYNLSDFKIFKECK